ncbi:transposase [Streptomyces sp. NPDC007205]|uniref:transposase n=1 Tax=Streptomyces sp. NPDC007205 TaxID=3154316 RepID=UPI0033EB206A
MMKYELARRLVPDGMWRLVEPLLPSFTGRRQGGGTAPLNERQTFTAVVYVLTSGCTWRQLPPWLGVSPATAHRRFITWTRVSLWGRLEEAAAGHADELWINDVVTTARKRAAARTSSEPC